MVVVVAAGVAGMEAVVKEAAGMRRADVSTMTKTTGAAAAAVVAGPHAAVVEIAAVADVPHQQQQQQPIPTTLEDKDYARRSRR